jgi:penicillin-binding protein 2
VTRAQTHDLEATLAEVGKLIEITPGQLRRFRRLLAESHEFETVPLKSKLSDEEVAILAANRYRLPGTEVKARLFRNYQAGNGMAHVVGFIGRINDRDLGNLRASGREQNYKGSVHIGKTGLEQSYETLLHGRTGFDQMETEASGRVVHAVANTAGARQGFAPASRCGTAGGGGHAFGNYRGCWQSTRKPAACWLVSKPGFDPNCLSMASTGNLEGTERIAAADGEPGAARPRRRSTIKPFRSWPGWSWAQPRTIADRAISPCPTAAINTATGRAAATASSTRAPFPSHAMSYYQLAADASIDRMHDYLAQFGLEKRPASTWTANRPACLRATGSSAAGANPGIGRNRDCGHRSGLQPGRRSAGRPPCSPTAASASSRVW